MLGESRHRSQARSVSDVLQRAVTGFHNARDCWAVLGLEDRHAHSRKAVFRGSLRLTQGPRASRDVGSVNEAVELPRSRTSPQVLANSLLTATRIRSDDTESLGPPPRGGRGPSDLDGRLGSYS